MKVSQGLPQEENEDTQARDFTSSLSSCFHLRSKFESLKGQLLRPGATVEYFMVKTKVSRKGEP